MKVTKKGQPLTAMGRAKLRKLRGRGRARDWHKSRKVRRVVDAQAFANRITTAAWFERQVAKVLGEVFSRENVRRAIGPLATAGDVQVKVRGVRV